MVRHRGLRAALLLGTALTMPVEALAQGMSPALPQGGRFTAGSGSIATAPGRLTVTQQGQRAVVDWRAFSIGAGQRVQFQNGSGATLNRVEGPASRIAGTLSATGSLYLVNPQGVVVAPGGRVVTGGGFVASTRPADAARFMASGTLAMQGSGPGDVVNQGRIETGREAVLVGRRVENAGAIRAGGTAVLAAAEQVILQREGDSARVAVRGGGGDVRSSGSVEAAEVALRAAGGNVYALAGQAGGYLRATGTATRGGRVMLLAGGDVAVEAPVAADGPRGGAVAVRAGGEARIAAPVTARGTQGDGGRVGVTGDRVRLAAGARLDASGARRGGSVLAGGSGSTAAAGADGAAAGRDGAAGGRDGQAARSATGARPGAGALPAAAHTEVAPGAVLAADGGSGAGGRVVVWSEQGTRFAGLISARGAAAGGFAEVSSRGVLSFSGLADLRGGRGPTGTLLLDPADVHVTDAAVPGGSTAISPAVIQAQLGLTNVTITTSGGSGNGDIFVAAPLAWASANTLTFEATRHVSVAAPVTASGGGSLVLRADSAGSGTGTVSFQAGGAVQVSGGGGVTILYNPTGYATPTDYTGQVSGAVPTALMLVNSAAQLAAVNGNLAGSYALGRDIELAGSGFAGIAQGATAFRGLFDGLNHRIGGLALDRRGDAAAGGGGLPYYGVGLFGTVDYAGMVRNLAVSGDVAGVQFVGLVAGFNYGSLQNVAATGTVRAEDSALPGYNYRGSYAGGISGVSFGRIAMAQADAAVTAVNYAGGISGYSNLSLVNAIAHGDVSSNYAGGIVGTNYGTLSNVLATGRVSGSSAGGVAGVASGSISNAYVDATVNPGLAAGGGTPLTTAQLQSGSLPAGFASDAWQAAAGGYPRLVSPLQAGGVLFGGAVSDAGGGGQGGATVGLVTGGTFYGPITADADGRWSYTARGATGSEALAALLAGPAGTTLVTGLAGGSTAMDLTPGLVRLIALGGGTTSLSGLLASQAGLAAIGDAATGGAAFSAPDPAAMGGTGLSVSAAGELVLDRAVVTTGTLRIAAGGAVSQGAALAAGRLELAAPDAPVVLAASGNRFAEVTGQAGSLVLTTGEALRVASGGLAVGGTARLTVGGRLTLEGGISAAGAGDALVLAAGSLVETVGAAGLGVSGGGRWLAYLPDPAQATLAGLAALPFYGRAAGESVAAAGNRLVYALQPVLHVTPDTVEQVYDGSVPSVGVQISGLLAGDSLATAVSGTPGVSGAVAGAGSHTVTATGALSSDLNYGFVFDSATLTVAPREVGWSVADAAATYGTPAVPGAVTLTGVLSGDAVTGVAAVSQGGAGVTLGARTPVGSYVVAATGLSGVAAANYRLAVSGVSGTLTIAPRELSWSVADAASTYGTLAVPGAVTLTGVLAGDAVSGVAGVSQGTAAVTLGARTPVGSYLVTATGLSGVAAANYRLAASGVTGTLTIAPRELSWSVADAASTYGTLAVPGAVTLTGVLAGDAVSGVAGVSQGGAGVTLGARTPVGSYLVAATGLSGAGSGNYRLAAGGVSGTLTIAPRELSWSVADAASTYGTLAVPGAVTLTGVLSGDAVSGVAGVSQGTAAVTLGARTPAGSYSQTASGLSGVAASNYRLAPSGVVGTLTIAPRELAWSVADASSTYGTLAVPGAVTVTGVLSGDAVNGIATVSQGGTAVTLGVRTPVGSYSQTASGLSGAAASNYRLAPSGVAGTLTIEPRELAWSVADAAATYGTLAVPGTVTLTGVLSGDAVNGIATVSQGGTAMTLGARSPAGSYVQTASGLSGASAANYRLAPSGVAGTLTIAPREVAWSVADAASTYGTLAVPGWVTLNGVLAGDTVSGVATVSQGGAAVTLGARTPVGSYSQTASGLSGAAASNYRLAPGGVTGTLTIGPREVAWSVADAAATYGTLAVPGSVTLTGVLAGDVVSGVAAVSQGGAGVTLGARTPAGRYSQTASGLSGASAANYRLAASGETGTLTIAPRDVAWSVADAAATYGTLAVPGAVTLTGVLAGDAVSGVAGVSQAGAAVTLSARTPVGSYSQTVSGLSGASSANYRLAPGGVGGTLTVSPRELAWSVADAAATYGTLAVPGAVTLTGVIAGDSVGGVAGVSQGGAAVTLGARTPVGSYSQAASGLSGVAASNYRLAATGATGTLTIGPREVAWSVADAASTYGSLARPGAVTLTGVLAGDAVSGVAAVLQGGAVVTLDARTPTGSYSQTASGLSGAASSNYRLAATGATGTLTIGPREVAWSVADAASTYGSLARPGAVTLTGVLAGDAVSGVAAVSQGGAAVTLGARTPAGSYSQTASGLSGASAANYRLAPSGVAGTLTIAPREVAWSVADAASTYGSLAVPGAVTLTGVLAGDALTGVATVSQGGAAVTLGARTPVGSYSQTASGLSGVAASNYRLAPSGVAGTLTIAPREVAWAVADAASTYGTLAVPGTVTLTGVLAGDAVSGVAVVSQGGAAVTLGARTPAGSYSQTASGLAGAASSNYRLALGGVTGTLTVAPREVAWSVADAASTYGSLAVPGAVTLTGVLAGDALTGVATVSQGGAAVTLGARTPVGSYGQTASGLSGVAASNYRLAPSGVAGTLTIAPREVAWSVADAASTYGTLAVPGAVTLTGVLAGDALTGVATVSQGGAAVSLGARTPAGSYGQTASGLSGVAASNYRLAPSGVAGTLTIAPRELAWSVADAAATYGTLTVPGTVTLTGVLAGDALTGVATVSQAGAVVTLNARSPAGSYVQTASGLSGVAASNYRLAPSGVAGTLTIAPRELAWSVADAAATYGTSAMPGTVTLTGVLDGDAVSGIATVWRDGTAVSLGTRTPAGSYSQTASAISGAASANYRLAANGVAGTLTIAPRLLQWSVPDLIAQAGQTPILASARLEGVLAGDEVAPLLGVMRQGEAVTPGPAMQPGGYALLVAALAGSGASNYALAEAGNRPGLLTIAPSASRLVVPPVVLPAMPAARPLPASAAPASGPAAPPPAAPSTAEPAPSGAAASASEGSPAQPEAAVVPAAPAATPPPTAPSTSAAAPAAAPPPGSPPTVAAAPAATPGSTPPSAAALAPSAIAVAPAVAPAPTPAAPSSPAAPAASQVAALAPGPSATPAPASAAPSIAAPATATTAAASATIAASLASSGAAAAQAAAAAGVATQAEAQAVFAGRAGEIIARGGSPAQAAAAAAQAVRQLAEAAATGSPAAVAEQRAAQELAGGGSLANAAAAALARGAPAEAALAQAAARAATESAMHAAAEVALDAGGRAVAALGQGSAGDLPPALAAALAAGAAPDQALARAAAAAAARQAMLAAAEVPIGAEAQAVAALAAGGAATAPPAIARALARGLPAEAAARAQAIAAASQADALARSVTGGGDAAAIALAGGVPPDGPLRLLPGGRLAAAPGGGAPAHATVALRPGDPAPELAAGGLPPDLAWELRGSPHLGAALADALRRGGDVEAALPLARARAAAAAAQAAAAELPVDELLPRLATARMEDGYLAGIAGAGDAARFTLLLGRMLQRRLPPAEALLQARDRPAPPAAPVIGDADRTSP